MRCVETRTLGHAPRIPLETFSKAVEAIYDCALDPTRWQDTISVVAELLQSQRCALVVYDYPSGHSKLAFQIGYAENTGDFMKVSIAV